jgi:HAD superfamily hydrolase (TIGR01549 family)
MSASPRWGSGTKQLVSAALLVLAGLLVYSFRGILTPLIITFLAAYILDPIVGWLSRHLHVRRGWAIAMVYLVIVAVLATVPAIAAPAVVNQVIDLVTNLGAITNRAITWLEEPHELLVFGRVLTIPAYEIPAISFDLERIISLVRGTISPLAGGAFSVIKTVASGVGLAVLMLVLSFYLLLDAGRVGSSLLSLVQPTYRREAAGILAQVSKTWNAFLRGQLLLCTFIGILTWLATSVAGLRFSIALGIIAGVLELIPSLGPLLAAVPAVLLALFQGSGILPTNNLGDAVIVASIYVLIHLIENNFLGPRIIGSSLHLRPMIVIIGVLGGVTLGGVLGALLAAPILATLRDMLRYVYCKLVDIDPFPEPPSFGAKIQANGVRAILFDLDGTLLDTDDMWVNRLAGLLQPVPFLARLYDARRLARRLIMAAESPVNLLVTAVDIVGLDDQFLSLGEWLRRVHGQRDPGRYVAIDGTVELVRDLSQHYDLAIVTLRNRAETQAFIEHFRLQDCFKTIVTRQDVKRLKPHPESVVRAARQLGYTPQQCLVVGDTVVDVRAGQRAGAMTVSVLCGFGGRSELAHLQPDLIVETTSQLAPHLHNLAAPSNPSW